MTKYVIYVVGAAVFIKFVIKFVIGFLITTVIGLLFLFDPTDSPAPPDSSVVVTVRTDTPELKIRTGSRRDDPVFGVLRAGKQAQASCWTTGERVLDKNVENHIWIKIFTLEYDPSHPDGYVWAGGLEGDEFANVSNQCP